ncbi:hypothetical protein LMB23_02650, partial [Limosilactobacillus reuteri]|nr:hypothetical protein [Limosilactobacillus reuteri]
DILSYRFGSLNMIPDVTPNGVFYLPPTGWLTSFYNPPMNLNSDSTKLIKNWLLKVPLDELRKKINECKNQSDKEWWERIYKIAAQRRK